jgi:hypothetical protein
MLAVGCIGAAGAQEKITLVRKAVKGQTIRYKTEGTLNLEVMGMKLTIELKQVEKTTILDVAPNGDVTSEGETESSEQTVNGMKIPSDDSDKSKTTAVTRANGDLVSYKSTAGDAEQAKFSVRLRAASNVIFPEKPIAVGDKWSHEYKADPSLGVHAGRADFQLVALEKMNGVDCAKITLVYKETQDSPALGSKATIWVDRSCGDDVVTEMEVENVQFGAGMAGAVASGKLRNDRIEGSSIGPVKGPDGKEIKAEKKDKTIDEVVKDYEKLAGFVTLYKKRENGRDTIYLELKESQLGQLMMLQATAGTGTSDQNQVVAGDPIKDIVFKLVQIQDDRIQLVVPNYNFRVDPAKPISRAVDRSFADAILEQFKIEARQPDRKSLLINISEFFKGDIAQVSSLFSGGGGGPLAALSGGGGSYSQDRDKTYISALKNFPENMVVETQYHFTGGRRAPRSLADLMSGGLLADTRSIPLKVVYNVFPLEGRAYKPRLYDNRVGYFTTDFMSFDFDDKQDSTVRFIYRWNLEKSDPKAALSTPKKPILFWLDNAIPLEYRDAVREGILRWNKAFEKLGFKDAVQVKQMPDNADWDHADMRYNTIRWVTSQDSAYAVAQFRTNPLTGEILNASITVDAGIVKFTKVEQQKIVDPASHFAEPPAPDARKLRDPRYCSMAREKQLEGRFGLMALNLLPGLAPVSQKTYVNSFISDVVSHEMGHILGLRHNFIASTEHTLAQLANPAVTKKYGMAASVMDYNPFNISALKSKGADFWMPTIGTYDYWAIEYGYTPIEAKSPDGELFRLRQIASKCNEPGHRYESDETADSIDPLITRFDMSADPLAYWERMANTTRYLSLQLGSRLPKKGESYWEFTSSFNTLLNLQARAGSVASRYIGASNLNRNHKGDTGEKPTIAPVSAKDQMRALKLLNNHFFSESAFRYPAEYWGKLTSNPNAGLIESILAGASDFPVRDTFSSIQTSALRRILSPAVLRRVANNEYKTENGTSFKLSYLMDSTAAAIWSELGTQRPITSLRRSLQRAHIDLLISILLNPAGPAPDDAKALAWNQLVTLQQRIAASRNGETYTKVHLRETAMRIKRALEAQQTIGGASAPSGNLLQMLLGGEDRPQR